MTDKALEELTNTRNRAHRKLLDQGSKPYRAFVGFERASFADGALARRHKELIAVGIAVRINCESRMQWYIEQAARDGASYEGVLEAVEVGIEMGGGPATVSAGFALKVMEAV